MLFKMSLHAIVVDERVIDIEQEQDSGRFGHRILFVPPSAAVPQTLTPEDA
jgi:hypothetical protein